VNLQIKQVGPNRRELLIKSPSGETRIFFSYETAVAGYSADVGYFRSATYYSVTTSKHIGQWLRAEGQNPKAVAELTEEKIQAMVG